MAEAPGGLTTAPHWLEQLARWLGRVWCGLRTGHRYQRQITGTHQALACVDCGHETRGVSSP